MISFSLTCFLLLLLVNKVQTFSKRIVGLKKIFQPKFVYKLDKELCVLEKQIGCGGYYTSNPNWSFGLLESVDVEKAVDLSMEAFFKPQLVLNTTGMNGFEKFVADGVLGIFTGSYSLGVSDR